MTLRTEPLRLALAQMNPTVGDLDGNAAKIRELIGRARDEEADLVVFPELALTGYPPEDLLLKPSFLDAAGAALQEELAGPFDAEVAAAGQAVVLARRADAGGTVALAWGHAQRASGPGDPRLRAFAEHWLGRGYADARGAGCPAPE